MSTSSAFDKDVKSEDEDEFDMNAVMEWRSSSTVVDNKAKWMNILEPSIDKSYAQVLLQCPHGSDQRLSLSAEPNKQTYFLTIDRGNFRRDIKAKFSEVLEMSGLEQTTPLEGSTIQLDLELSEVSTTNSNITELTFHAEMTVIQSQEQHPMKLKTTHTYCFPLMGRSFELATKQGIQDLKDRLQTAGIAGNLCEHIISDLSSVLDSSKTEHAVLQRLSSIQPPTLSDLHLSIKLRPDPTWGIIEGVQCYSYNQCRLNARVTFSGATWENARKTWKPITVEDTQSLWESGPGEISFPVELRTSNENLFCLDAQMVKHNNLFMLPVSFASTRNILQV